MNLTAKLLTSSGKELCAKAYEKSLDDGVVAVYIDGKADEGLNSEHGADILFDIEDVEGITALQRQSEFWCEPMFCGNTSGIPDETQLLVVKHNNGNFTWCFPLFPKNTDVLFMVMKKAYTQSFSLGLTVLKSVTALHLHISVQMIPVKHHRFALRRQ